MATRTASPRPWALAAAGALVVVSLPNLAARMTLGLQRIPLTYNEGWNAFHALRHAQGGPLYLPPDGLVANNYPPLSFELVRLFAGSGADLIMVLRVLALVGLVTTVALVGATVAQVGRSRVAGVLASALLLATFAGPFREYVAMADPTLVAHALLAVAMYVAVRWWESDRMLVVALVFQLLAGLTKHNLVALPVATALALLLESRRRGLKLIAVGVPLGIAGVAFIRLGYGPDAMASILASRRITLALAVRKWREMLPPVVLPMVVGLAGGAAWLRRPVERLFVIYLVLGLALAMFFAGGAGTNVNVFFDAAIASVVLCGLLVARGIEVGVPRWLAWSPLLLAAVLARQARWSWGEAQAVLRGDAVATRVAATTREVALIQAEPGPVACEMLSLCYWAGKGFEVDFFNAAQALYTGRAGEDNLRTRLLSGRYRVVQVLRPPPRRLPLSPGDTVNVLAGYVVVSQSVNGVVLRRRE